MAEITNYDDLIKKADEVGTKLSEEQVEDIADTLSEIGESNHSVQELRDAQKAAEEFDGEGEVGEGVAVIDPSTGKVKDVLDIESTSFADITLDDVLNDDSIIAEPVKPENAIVNEESILTVTKDLFAMNEENSPLTVMDIQMITAATDRYKKGEKFPYYNAMPQAIKDQINAGISSGEPGLNMGSFLKQGRNYAAEQFLEYIVRESVMNTEIIDLQHSMHKVMAEGREELNKTMTTMNTTQKKYYEETILETAAKLEEHGETEKAELLKRCSRNYIQAYTYEDFLSMYQRGKIKVKPIQIDKFNRTCAEFNMKYKDSKTSITDISTVVPVLDRHADKKYDLVVLKEFVCAFVNYTMNMKATNIDDHIFMYFFITNILSFDYYDENNEEDKKFHDDLLNTINNFLEIICKRRQEKGLKGGK